MSFYIKEIHTFGKSVISILSFSISKFFYIQASFFYPSTLIEKLSTSKKLSVEITVENNQPLLKVAWK